MRNDTATIGISIPYRNSDFMKSIMNSGIADSGMDSTGDVYFEDNAHYDREVTDLEFKQFLKEYGVDAELFRD